MLSNRITEGCMNLRKNSWETFLSKLPEELKREIFKFLNPNIDTRKIKFDFFSCPNFTNYDHRYKVAYNNVTNNVLDTGVNFKVTFLLSRIEKKNGKHRYYLTEETHTFICQGCGRKACCSQYCRGGLEDEYYYQSKYIGKCLEYALYKFYETPVIS
jgi:hypothetical protein